MDKSQINTIAEEIVRKYNPEGFTPFPFEKILKDKDDLGLFISDKLSEDRLSGAILFDKEEKRFSIVINKNKPEARQYFTIAHELGHYFLHSNIIKEEEAIIDTENVAANPALYRMDSAKSTEIEIEANNFAAELLMPAELVKKAWSITNDVEATALIFKVSISAMSIRLERLGLII